MAARYLLLAVLALAAIPCLAQTLAGTVIDFKVTATATMQGTAAMPARTMERKVCMAPGKFDPQALLHQGGDCRVSDYQVKGDTTTFHVACTAPQAVASDGEFHRRADGGFDGSMHSTMTAGGREVSMETTYQGTPGGACTPAAK